MKLPLSLFRFRGRYLFLKDLLQSKTIVDLKIIYSLLTKKTTAILRSFIFISVLSGLADLSLVASLIALFELIGNSDTSLPSIPLQLYSYFSDVLGFLDLPFSVWCGTAISAAIAGILGLLSFFRGAQFAAVATSNIGSKFFNSLINRDYNYYRSKSSTEVQSELAYLDILESQVLRSFSKIISGSIQMLIMSIGVLILMPIVFVTVITILLIVYGLTIYISKSRVVLLGTKKGQAKQSLIRLANEITSNYKEIILRDMRSEKLFKYDSKEGKYRKTGLYLQLFSQSTRYVIESCILVFLCAFGAFSNTNGFIINIGALGGLVLAFRKIIPGVQQIYNSLVNIKSSNYIIERITKEIDYNYNQSFVYKHTNSKDSTKDIITNDMLIDSDIIFRDLALEINHNENFVYLFKQLSFKLKLGDCLFISGISGSGKSSLIDIMMGLVKPTAGTVLLQNDEESRDIEIFKNSYWMNLISHVSQRIVLLDKTIMDNITYGSLGDVDNEKLNLVCRAACFDKIIETKAGGYNYFVGEEGSNLSGGEKQRLGIARALYQNRPILFLDEAMNALDLHTEIEITKRIKKLYEKRILICISHNSYMEKFYSKKIELSYNM